MTTEIGALVAGIAAEQRIPEEKMKNDPSEPKESGRAREIPTKLPEPDHHTMVTTATENNTSSGMRGNIILTLTDQQNRLAEWMNRKIEGPDKRLTVLEDDKIRDSRTGSAR